MKANWPGIGSTYRLQLNRNFGFDRASEVVAYIQQLGISHTYLSPILRSGSESTHGYDVCSQDEIDPKLGEKGAFDTFLRRLDALGLGLLLDIVPNHMRTDLTNRWWLDVLENGLSSRFANHFDIDWESEAPNLHHRVLVPVLGGPYAEVLERGELKLVFVKGRFWSSYYQHRFPLSLPSSLEILKASCASLPTNSPARSTVEALISGCHDSAEAISTQLEDLYLSCGAFREAVDCYLTAINGIPGRADSFNQLDLILEQQHYRLCWWRIASDQINYRRFFEITDLICLNAQRAEVFESSHPLVRFLIESGIPLGLRVDHPDGLWNPQEYFARLQGLRKSETQFVVAEKILEANEEVPRDWPVAGTTGYEFLNQLNAIFVDERNESALSKIYNSFTGVAEDFGSILFRCRFKVLHQSFRGQFESLVGKLVRLSSRTRYGRDLTAAGIRETFAAFICAFPVYRTYVTDQTVRLSLQDWRAVEIARRECRRRVPGVDVAVLDLLRSVYLLEFPREKQDTGNSTDATLADARVFIMKLQQLTAPLAAKGMEDTACYIYNRLISLNEVGGNPGCFGGSVHTFHRRNLRRARRWPDSLLATSTHDTKRGEDARGRVNVLSEIPAEWSAALQRWTEINAAAKSPVNGEPAPSRNDEYLAYQALVGAWPDDFAKDSAAFRDRVIGYLVKAARESKEQTAWIDPNASYEEAIQAFVERILSPVHENAFLSDFARFQERVSFFGRLNSLSQTLLKITSPGIADFYQGSELWDLAMVDPDNRRPVDYTKRMELLNVLTGSFEKLPRSQFLSQLMADAPSGAVKMFSIWRLLQFRRARPELFARGRYLPVSVVGPAARHLCAFVRQLGNEEFIAVAPRLVFTLLAGREQLPVGEQVWLDTRLRWAGARPGVHFTELFSGRSLETRPLPGGAGFDASDILAEFPIALLSRAT